MKIKIGELFGGTSKEREISFAGGRTVYDNLNKSLFEPVAIFVDSFGNFIKLKWEYIYKGSIRDFYPPVDFVPDSKGEFQVYAENLGKLSVGQQDDLLEKIGRKIYPSELKSLLDFAFLCLHGPFGEDGRIQGFLEYCGIPYSGSGIFASALGMNKALQKKLMHDAGFASPNFLAVSKDKVLQANIVSKIYNEVKSEIGFPCVVKPANQGSSIGVSILESASDNQFRDALLNSFFIKEIKKDYWDKSSHSEKTECIRIIFLNFF